MRKILLDTNFLVYIAKYKIDLFSELNRICGFTYTLHILSGTLEELERLEFKELKLIKVYLKDVEVIESKNNVDDELVEYSRQGDIIATQDKELKKRLKNSYIIIRQKKYLELK